MKRSLFTKHFKQTLLAVPAAALMLGAAHAGTTIGLNFQSYYYDSGTTPQTVGYGYGYQTTGVPVTAKAFGVDVADWFNSDPLPCQTAVSASVPFGGTLTANVTAANMWESGFTAPGVSGDSGGPWSADNWPAGSIVVGEIVPGNYQVTWSFMDNTGWSLGVTGLNTKFPNGYVIDLIGGDKTTTTSSINITEDAGGTTVGTVTFTVLPDSMGLGASPVLHNDAITLNNPSRPDTANCALAGFILTDKPVVDRSPASGAYLPGQSINLSVRAVGLLPLSYQWLSNGIPIIGATATNLTVPSNATGSFTYDVIVTNLYGNATSEVATVTVAVPADLTWDADPGMTGPQDGSGTWDSTTANWWNGSADVVWGDLNNAVFGAGGTGTYFNNVANSVTVNSLVFDSGNYTIAGAGITLAGASEIAANNNAHGIISSPLSGTGGLTKTGTGTVTLSAQEPYTGNTVVSGGTLDLAVGGSSGTLQGNLTVNSNATVLCSVNNALGYSGNYWVTNITLNFGTLTTSVTTDNGWGTTIKMTGGTLGTTVPGGYFAMGSDTGTSDPTFNVTGASIPSVISADLTVRNGAPGGIVFNVTRGSAASDLVISGNLRAAGTGGITLNGGGIMQLSGTNNYSGGTMVNEGATLAVTGRLNGDGTLTLLDNTTLNVTAAGVNPVITTATADLTVGTGSGTNTFGFAGLSSMTVAPITVGGYFGGGNPLTIKILSLNPVIGSYPLIHAGSGYLGDTSLILPSGYTATLSNDIAGPSQTLYLNVTGVPQVPVSIVTDLPGTTDQRYAGATYTLSVAAYGTPPFTYLWTHNGTPVGGNSPTLTLTGLTTTANGAYSVTVTNALASVPSATNHLVVVQPPGYDSAVIATGPIAYWPLNETSGITAYDVWGNNNATYSGGVTLNVAGPVGTTGVTLDGIAGTKIVAPYSSTLNPNGDFTVECWINPANITGGNAVLVQSMINGENGANANDRSGWCFRQNADTLTFILGGTTGAPFYTTTATSGSVLTAGVWQYVAAVYTAATTNITITVNSNEVLNVTGAEPLIPNYAAPLIMGDRGYGGWLYTGSISGVALYNRSLTLSELQSHAGYTAATVPSTIIVTRSGVNLILSWTSGTLQAAPEVTGTYTNVPAAVSPFTVTPTEARKFFRLIN